MNRPNPALLRKIIEFKVPQGVKNAGRTGVAKLIERRVVTYRELREREGVRTWRFDEPRTYVFDEPEYHNGIPDEISKLFGRHTCHQPYVMELRNAAVVGEPGIIVTDLGEFAVFNFDRELSNTAKKDAANALSYDITEAISQGTVPFSIRSNRGDFVEFDVAVSLLNKWATNYSHWTEECLPLLEGVRHYVSETDIEPTILIPPDPPSFIPESLHCLGYSDEDYIEFTGDRANVDRLVVPSPRRFYSDTGDDYVRMISGLQWLQQEVLRAVDDDNSESRKLLISREDAETRRVVNRDEVEEALSNRGFETVILTELDYMTQKRLFSAADIVVGVHGAGLNEIVFTPDATVVELYGDYMVPTFYEIAKGFGLPYGCVRCKDVDGDIHVDVDELLAAIDYLGDIQREPQF